MLKHVIFTSQQSACSRPAWNNWAVISITDVGADDARLQQGWHDILRLGFDDIHHEEYGYVICEAFHARAIIEFVEHCNGEKVEGILVHCKAGISRSAAVAKWISHRILNDRHDSSKDCLLDNSPVVNISFLTVYGEIRNRSGINCYSRNCDVAVNGFLAKSEIHGAHLVLSFEDCNPIQKLVDRLSPLENS